MPCKVTNFLATNTINLLPFITLHFFIGFVSLHNIFFIIFSRFIPKATNVAISRPLESLETSLVEEAKTLINKTNEYYITS